MYYTLTLIKSGYDISALPEDIQASIGQVLSYNEYNGTVEALDREIILSINSSQPYDERVAKLVELVNLDESEINDGFATKWAQHEAEIKYTSEEVEFSDLTGFDVTDVIFDRKKYNLVQTHNWLAKHGYPSRLPQLTESTIEYEFKNETPDTKAKIGPGVMAYLKTQENGVD